MLYFLLALILLGAVSRHGKHFHSFDGVAIIVCLAFGWLAAMVQAPALVPASYFETDFADYCIGIIALGNEEIPIPPKRTRLAALLPYLFSTQLGIVNGLAAAAWASTAGIGLGLYFWGRALAGRAAGIAAAAIALTMAPIVGLSRFINYYPEIVLCFVWAAAWLAMAFTDKKPHRLFWAGLGVAFCLLIDSRGLIWALPYAGASVLAIVQRKGLNGKVWAFLFFALPIYCSWYVGWWSYELYSSPLEKQIDVRPLFVGFDEDNPMLKPPWNYPSQFVWGWSPITQLPETIRFLWVQKNIPAPQGFLDWQNALKLKTDYFQVWRQFALWAGAISMLSLWSKPWKMIGLLSSLTPFIAAFIGIETMVEQHIRFFTHALPAVALLGGVACAQFLYVGDRFSLFQKPISYAWRISLFGTLSLLLVLGVWPTWISPKADWRPDWKIAARTLDKIQKMAEAGVGFQDNSWEADCARALQGDGGPIDITVYSAWESE
ncbi:MAG: hypothetical protein ACON4U_18885 [Myxococcota bacterium]